MSGTPDGGAVLALGGGEERLFLQIRSPDVFTLNAPPTVTLCCFDDIICDNTVRRRPRLVSSS